MMPNPAYYTAKFQDFHIIEKRACTMVVRAAREGDPPLEFTRMTKRDQDVSNTINQMPRRFNLDAKGEFVQVMPYIVGPKEGEPKPSPLDLNDLEV